MTATPTLGHPHWPFPKPARSYKPHSLLDGNRKTAGSKNSPNVRKHGVAVGAPNFRTEVVQQTSSPGMHWKRGGGVAPPPASRAPSLRPATSP